MSYLNFNNVPIVDNHNHNSMYCFGHRESGLMLSSEATITGTGSQVINVLQFTGTIMIINQAAEITEVTTLNNCTGVYADVYDGTNSVDLTADGAVLSGAPVGTFLQRTKYRVRLMMLALRMRLE